MRTMLLAAVLLHAPLAWGQDSTTPAQPAEPVVLSSGDPAAEWGWAFLGALEFGGDTVAKVYFTDGSSQTVNAGQGGTLGIGVRYRPYENARWGVRSTIGYKFVMTAASNSDMGIDRMAWDLIANYRVDDALWFGGGLVRHMNTRFNGDGFAPDLAFDDAMGLRLELGWKWFALGYTRMTYTDEFGFDYDASSIGLVMTNAF